MKYDKDTNPLKPLKDTYENVKIPTDLSQIVQDTIWKATKELEEKGIQTSVAETNEPQEPRQAINTEEKLSTGVTNTKLVSPKKRIRKKMLQSFIAVAAAIAIMIGAFGVTIATNPAFAQSVEKVPLLSSIARIFTGNEIKEKDNVSDVKALIPEVQGLENVALQKEINEKVNSKVQTAIVEMKQVVAEYKEAFLATGGKEADYIPPKINVDYSVKCMTENILSFVIYKSQDLANAYNEQVFYNYDIVSGKELTLKDVLGKDYKNIANKQIELQITERSKNDNTVYFKPNEGGFTSIKEDQHFYISKSGNPVVCFDRYEIAPGSTGYPEFEIKK